MYTTLELYKKLYRFIILLLYSALDVKLEVALSVATFEIFMKVMQYIRCKLNSYTLSGPIEKKKEGHLPAPF